LSPPSPKISVLLPVYNAERHLALAVESILKQSYGDFECLALDDGSKDGSLDILRSFEKRDARVRVTSRENRGLVATLNELTEQASGAFFARMDSDDVARPDRFAVQVAFLEEHPDTVCVGGCHGMIDERGRFLTTLRVPLTDADIQTKILRGHGAICHPTAMIRADALRKVGGYDSEMRHCEDLDLWLRLGEIGKLANVQEVVLDYRLDSQSVSAQNWQEQRENGLVACQRAWKRRGIEGRYEAGQPWRPDGTRRGNSRHYLKYGWWAFQSGQRKTALYYAGRALLERPSVSALRLAGSALLKPHPDSSSASTATNARASERRGSR
jgi:glycosyltransferase involved in cell wall biosynthesis